MVQEPRRKGEKKGKARRREEGTLQRQELLKVRAERRLSSLSQDLGWTSLARDSELTGQQQTPISVETETLTATRFQAYFSKTCILLSQAEGANLGRSLINGMERRPCLNLLQPLMLANVDLTQRSIYVLSMDFAHRKESIAPLGPFEWTNILPGPAHIT